MLHNKIKAVINSRSRLDTRLARWVGVMRCMIDKENEG